MKNVLFITYDYPYPTTSGGKNRAYNMLKYSGDHKKYLLSFIRNDFKESYRDELNKIGVETVGLVPRKKLADFKNIPSLILGKSIFRTLYYSKDTESMILTLIHEKKIDVVHFESYYTAFYISQKLRQMGVTQIFGTENIEYKMYKNYADSSIPLVSSLLNLQVGRIKAEEEAFYKAADMNIAVSDPDASYIRRFSECEIVRNGVDVKGLEFRERKGDGKKLLFVGNFSYFPNIDAIRFFYNEVFVGLPEDFQLTVVGKKADTLEIKKDKRVRLINFIEDISEAYYENDIMVSPIRLGGGTNFKILEAMAAGTPVIALPNNLAGLEVSDNKNIIVVHSALDYKKSIIDIALDPGRRNEMARAARGVVEEKYSWENIGAALAEVWEKTRIK